MTGHLGHAHRLEYCLALEPLVSFDFMAHNEIVSFGH